MPRFPAENPLRRGGARKARRVLAQGRERRNTATTLGQAAISVDFPGKINQLAPWERSVAGRRRTSQLSGRSSRRYISACVTRSSGTTTVRGAVRFFVLLSAARRSARPRGGGEGEDRFAESRRVHPSPSRCYATAPPSRTRGEGIFAL